MSRLSAYDAYITREPWYMDEGPLWPDVRCDVCGCFVAYHGLHAIPSKNFIRTEDIPGHDTCYGTGGDYDVHDQCPLQQWIEVTDPRHDGRTGNGLYFKTNERRPYWHVPEHGKHEISVYNGVRSWYKCSHCGTEISVEDF